MLRDRAITRLFKFTKTHNSRYVKNLSTDNYVFVDENDIDANTGKHNKSALKCDDNNQWYIQIALPHSFYDDEANQVSEYDFVRTALSVSHELWHYKQVTSSFLFGTMIDEAKSYVSRCGNDDAYGDNYHLFAYEIGAERHAIKSTREILQESYSHDVLATDDILVDYVNGRTRFDKDDNGDDLGEYFIPEANYKNVDDIIRAFDKAYIESPLVLKHFENYKDDKLGAIIENDASLKNEIANLQSGTDETSLAVKVLVSQTNDKTLKQMGRTIARSEFLQEHNPLKGIANRLRDTSVQRKMIENSCESLQADLGKQEIYDII